MKPHQLGFQIDLSRCIGCHACVNACSHKHAGIHTVFRHLKAVEDSHDCLTLACNHCAAPECIRVCPSHCYSKLRNGIVIHHSTACTGCGRCVGACPFHAPRLLPQTKKVDKCDLCWDRLQQDLPPACVNACLVGALRLVDMRTVPPDLRQMAESYAMTTFTHPSICILPAQPTTCFWRTEEHHVRD